MNIDKVAKYIRHVLCILCLLFVHAHLSADPFLFKENKNQWAEETLYRADLPGGYLHLQRNALIYSFYDEQALHEKHAGRGHEHGPAARVSVAENPNAIAAHGFKVDFFRAEKNVKLIPKNAFDLSFNYYLGNDPGKWAQNVKAYQEIYYQGLYKGIDMRYFFNGQDFKYEFIVAPNSKVKQIKLDYSGQSAIQLKNGHLYIKTSVNEIIEQQPYSYQVINGKKIEIPTRFVLKNNRLSFDFPEGYDKAYTLVIDPVLIFSTFSGSVSDNWGNTATYDEQGSLYAGGIAFGNDFPATIGAFQVDFSGQIDIAIAKYDSAGTKQEYATYLGGSYAETPHSLVVNAQQELVIFGTTSSSDFPVADTAYKANFEGGGLGSIIGGVEYLFGSDIIIAKLDSTGSNLLASTFFGGSEQDGINELSRTVLTRNYGDEFRGDVITDSTGNIYIATSTHSTNITTTAGGIKTELGGEQDGLIAKFNPTLTNLEWGTLLGGGGNDAVYNIKLNSNNEVIVVGGTSSLDFPTTLAVLKEEFSGGSADGFISIISNDGTQLIASTYLGTDAYDQAYLLDLDAAGNITVFGQTSGDYPISVNVYNNPNSGQFVHKIGGGLKTTIFSTVVGSGRGSPDICPTALLVNECSNIYLTGWGGNVNSVDPNYVGGNTFNMPITEDAFQNSTDGNDFYLMVLSSDADELLYATYFGGNMGTGEHVDGGTSRFDKKGVVYQAVCSCGQSNYPTTPGAFDRFNNSTTNGTNTRCNNAAFKFDLAILKADFKYTPNPACVPAPVVFENTSRGGVDFTWKINGTTVSTADTSFVYEFPEPGEYFIELTVLDPATCKLIDTLQDTIQIGEQNFAVGEGGFICGGEDFQLEASGAEVYRWSPQTYLNNPNLPNPVATPPETTTYTVTMVNDFGCRVDSSVTITVQPEVVADFRVNLIETCDTLPTIEIINNSQNVQEYAWILGDDRIIEGEDPGMIYYDSPGNYQIVLLGINGVCSDADTVNVQVDIVESSLFFRDIQISPTQEICFGESVQLEVSGGIAYQWSPVNGLDNALSDRPIANPTDSTTYTVRVLNRNGCFVDTTVQVNVFPEIKADFEIVEDDECGEKPLINFKNLSEGADAYLWNFGNGEQSTDIEPSMYAYQDTGRYIVTLFATRGECTENFSRQILIEQVVPPNAFSPNADNVNERFVLPSQKEGWHLEVFNRWGDLIYENENYKDQWSAEGIPEGVYHYILISPLGTECKGWVKVFK